jgi:hypothetical protein
MGEVLGKSFKTNQIFFLVSVAIALFSMESKVPQRAGGLMDEERVKTGSELKFSAELINFFKLPGASWFPHEQITVSLHRGKKFPQVLFMCVRGIKAGWTLENDKLGV